jgi:hypothetical protein
MRNPNNQGGRYWGLVNTTGSGKSNTASSKPAVLISQLVDKIGNITLTAIYSNFFIAQQQLYAMGLVAVLFYQA